MSESEHEQPSKRYRDNTNNGYERDNYEQLNNFTCYTCKKNNMNEFVWDINCVLTNSNTCTDCAFRMGLYTMMENSRKIFNNQKEEQKSVNDIINEPIINNTIIINDPIINDTIIINDPIINSPIVNDHIIDEQIINDSIINK